jgi:NAD(P)-dependent dehydrogenase (short-subunit alcohol dehydrogenase family)
MGEFSGKSVLVTGGTSGIGFAVARAFLREGASVVICGRSEERGRFALNQLTDFGDEIKFLEADVRDESKVKRLLQYSLDCFDNLDFAFNNAGVFLHEPPFHEHNSEVWEEVISANLTGVYYCMKHEIIAMGRARPESHRAIVNNASIVAHRGSQSSGLAYTAAKHGVLGLTKQAAINHVIDNIRVNAVSPGPTLTEATKAGLEGVPEEVQEKIKALNPAGTLVDEDEIAATVLFLCSGSATMINGHDIPLDGGQLAKL